MILEQWFLTTFVEASANFQEGLKMTLIIQNKAKQTLTQIFFYKSIYVLF